ncbi:hypothetical protein QNI19_19390 [Cytophagaceae bacterium DM2B3-1]|uniref:ZU5 domain-containing protein n=1 Tax=Xanthocytophaga flava TaxID=3048013 RepID=A0ABT7CQA4_9BACT|nr:hypothetical protein [Xanthocytophaga flavus]MDJ1472115.1 hypothetical protein [Xanthocytophaga flavus]MDJ1495112.1 hypothetical protein [Xanthocytophaga flavus]
MKVFKRTLYTLLVFSSMLLIACDDKKDPVITDPSEKVIGTEGGSVTSEDSKVLVTIPGQAITSSITVSVKPTSTKATNGIGSVYKISPEGTTFSKPVTISFKYTESDAQQTNPELMSIAYKKADNTWEILSNVQLNKSSKSVSVQTNHFSEWSLVSVNEGVSFKVSAFSVEDMPGTFTRESHNSNDVYALEGTANGQIFSLSVLANNLKSGIKHPLYSLAYNSDDYTNLEGKYLIQPYGFSPLQDTTLNYIRPTSIADSIGKYNIGEFSLLVNVLKYTSNSGSDTIAVTHQDTLRGLYRIKKTQ